MKAAIEKELKAANLQNIDITVTKIIQLHETKNSRLASVHARVCMHIYARVPHPYCRHIHIHIYVYVYMPAVWMGHTCIYMYVHLLYTHSKIDSPYDTSSAAHPTEGPPGWPTGLAQLSCQGSPANQQELETAHLRDSACVFRPITLAIALILWPESQLRKPPVGSTDQEQRALSFQF